MYLGGALAHVWAQDAADVLDEAPLECDRRGQEQCVQDRAVEAFTDLGAGRDDEQGRLAGWVEACQGGLPCLGAHAAAQDDGVEAFAP